MSKSIIACKDLSIRYPSSGTQIENLSFEITKGECFALVGRSGSGKTTLTKALMGLHQESTEIEGEILFHSQNLATADQRHWRTIRGLEIGYVSQNPWGACDPRRTVLDHIKEAWHCQGRKTSPDDIIEALVAIGVTDAVNQVDAYPHLWSGGMLQRASIVAATAHKPSLIIADEPTSALDTDLSQTVLTSIKKRSSAVLLVSHDIELVMHNADRIGILHEGQLVEIISPAELTKNMHHSATRAFLYALGAAKPSLAKAKQAPLVALERASVGYEGAKSLILNDINLTISTGEIIGILGPSGCGKSTLLKLITGLLDCHSGTMVKSSSLARPGSIMPIFQNPSASLPLSWPIWRIVTEPLTASHLKRTSRKRRREIARTALVEIGLGDIDLETKAWALSVGQKQRVCISRLERAEPELIVADEPTSALDTISSQKVAELLTRLAEKGTAVLVVSHNRMFLNRICDRQFHFDQTRKTIVEMPPEVDIQD